MIGPSKCTVYGVAISTGLMKTSGSSVWPGRTARYLVGEARSREYQGPVQIPGMRGDSKEKRLVI
jgi:hypothetical protein